MFIFIIIFFIVLVLYIHLIYQYKKSEDFEIYEIDYTDNKDLQEICNMKQPILFSNNFHDNILFDISLDKYKSFDLKVKDVNDYYENQIVNYIVLNNIDFIKLTNNDTLSRYITENNEKFLEETGLIKNYSLIDFFLKPLFIVQTKYDFMFGSSGVVTPLRYHTNYRQFYLVSDGSISVKMTPYKNFKHLNVYKNYNNYEFYSQIPCNNKTKVEFLEFNVNKGYILYVPSYWFYSIKYNTNKTIVCGFVYNSPINILSNLPDIIKYRLQNLNTKQKIVKTIDMCSETKKLVEISDENEKVEIEEDNFVKILNSI
jgi:hypothetical protein